MVVYDTMECFGVFEERLSDKVFEIMVSFEAAEYFKNVATSQEQVLSADNRRDTVFKELKDMDVQLGT